MTNGKRRRVMAVFLVLCLLLIVLIGVQMWHSLRTDRAIVYRDPFPGATPAALCPGEAFTFPLSIDIMYGDSVTRITEGWCRASDGICPRLLQTEPYYINFVEPYSVTVTASRTVPAELAPGAWELRHCNEVHASGLIDVTCWQVEVEVLDCPAP
jgi:hypothetical protein